MTEPLELQLLPWAYDDSKVKRVLLDAFPFMISLTTSRRMDV
jgi:hypothetical protein